MFILLVLCMAQCLFVSQLAARQTADADRTEGSWHGPPVLTYEIVGLSDVVVPHGHLQGLLGEVCIFNVITELLQRTGEKIRAPVVFLSSVITHN